MPLGGGAGQGAAAGPPPPSSAWPGTSSGAASCPRPRRKGRAPRQGSLPLPPAPPDRTFGWCRCYLLKRLRLAFSPPYPKIQGAARFGGGARRGLFLFAPTPSRAGALFWAFLGGGEGGFHRFPPQSLFSSENCGGQSRPCWNLVNCALGQGAVWLLVK